MVNMSGVGRLGKDPKMQYTDGGTAKTFFNVATDVGFGENKKTIWMSLTAWGTLAETLNKYLEKGSKISFTAEITDLTTYEKSDGSSAPALYGKILTCEFLSGIAKQDGNTPYDGGNEPEEF